LSAVKGTATQPGADKRIDQCLDDHRVMAIAFAAELAAPVGSG
jgi:hypothetical protein